MALLGRVQRAHDGGWAPQHGKEVASACGAFLPQKTKNKQKNTLTYALCPPQHPPSCRSAPALAIWGPPTLVQLHLSPWCS